MKKLYQPPKRAKCGGKNCYPTRHEAELVAREQEALNFQDDLKLKVYRCIDCGAWHLTRIKPVSDKI
jgi:hypothetical protein